MRSLFSREEEGRQGPVEPTGMKTRALGSESLQLLMDQRSQEGPECTHHYGCETGHLFRGWDGRGLETAQCLVTILTLCPLECGTLDQTWFPALHYDSGGKREHLLSLGPLQGREETWMPPSCPQKKLPFHLKTRQPPYQCLCQQNLGAVWGVSNNSTGVLEIWVH